MHSSEAPSPPPPATGPDLLVQLGRLVVRARSATRNKLKTAPSTSQVHNQPKPQTEEAKNGVESQLGSYVNALWEEHIPICIEVLLAPDCAECRESLRRVDDESYDATHCRQRAVLIERWTMRAHRNKAHEYPAFINAQWLLNAVRSQLHFSQLSAWLARLKESNNPDQDDTAVRRRKLSRETCNFKKVEANCDDSELTDSGKPKRDLNVIYSIKIPGESYKMTEFSKPPVDHTFPTTNIGSNVSLKVQLESLPRTEEIPVVKCTCNIKRRASKELSAKAHEEMVGKFSDLSIGPRFPEAVKNSGVGTSSRRLSISHPGPAEYVEKDDINGADRLLDDRMHTPCSENGKHKCSCDEESDGKESNKSSTSLGREAKNFDEKRLREIAKHKRRLKKDVRSKRRFDSSSSEDCAQRVKETRTSIPILQAARFDRSKAIGCYRNQTYLTLPVSRIECKSPFIDSISIPQADSKKTNTISTQTDGFNCYCGALLKVECSDCDRSESGSQNNLKAASKSVPIKEFSDRNSETEDNGGRRKCEDDNRTLKKPKCDNFSDSAKCDMNLVDDSFTYNGCDSEEFRIRRPRIRRMPIVDKMTKVVTERHAQKDKDIEELLLKHDDTVFEGPEKQDRKRQKTFSLSEDDYVLFEKCEYGTIESSELESPKEEQCDLDFNSQENQDTNNVPSSSEMDRFRWTFDSAASMVFHTKTGLPLTSSPAPLKRGNSCFDFDDSINGISGIKSALFHPISPPTPIAPVPRSLTPPPSRRDIRQPKLKHTTSTGLLGSFEESALKGRLEPVATVVGFSAELGASGELCPPHRRLPVTVFFYAPGGTNAPYMGHINLGASGYRVSRSGTIQVSLFNPHGTLVKMFVVLYDLTRMPPGARTFLRQRTLYMPAGAPPPPPDEVHKWLRYLIHLRFMTSKSGKLYLHTDIRILVSRKVDLDTATAHYAIGPANPKTTKTNEKTNQKTNSERSPIRVFGGCADFDEKPKEGVENGSGVSYELRSFTYAPDNPKYSPR